MERGGGDASVGLLGLIPKESPDRRAISCVMPRARVVARGGGASRRRPVVAAGAGAALCLRGEGAASRSLS